mmetsp:Transcript_2269/g.3317  ORF Transcript_2269/g.3317 Transcript_2269/m.3317 type:complete len:89 (+) Transcript_2269:152-418(+)
MLLERGSGNGTSALNSYALHFVSRPDYVSGVPTADLTLCGFSTRKLCAVGRNNGQECVYRKSSSRAFDTRRRTLHSPSSPPTPGGIMA